MAGDNTSGILPALAGDSAEFTTRPVLYGTHGMVTSGHYLATRIGLNVLEQGGNAVDAGVAMGFALAVLEPHLYGIGGEAPILIYLAAEKRVLSLSGQGPAPRAASIDWFRSRGIKVIPGDGLLAAAVPAAIDTLILALSRFGTMQLSQVLEYARDLAEQGFPMYEGLRYSVQRNADRFRAEWPSSAEVFLPDDKVPVIGNVFKQLDLAKIFTKLLDAEQQEHRNGRREALQAARDVFYKGDIAEAIERFARENAFYDATGRRNQGLITRSDLSEYAARIDKPVTLSYHGYDVYKCGPWTQGPVFLQQLGLLEGYDLAAAGHNSPVYIHLVTEAAKLAFADRERWYGDPDFVPVPLARLLSKEYAAMRRALIDPDRASLEQQPGDAAPFMVQEATTGRITDSGDTTHLDAVDKWGNLISITPSGGWLSSSPVVSGLGFPLGTRLQMFSLDPAHPNTLQPGKRPRTTLTPSLAIKNNDVFLAFGTPGGDQQDQWTLQFFLNHIVFNMDLQTALDAPTFHTLHFPSSFYPHESQPGTLVVEGRIAESTREALRKKGHIVKTTGDWSNGRVLAVRFDAKQGVMSGAASARRETGYAMGW